LLEWQVIFNDIDLIRKISARIYDVKKGCWWE